MLAKNTVIRILEHLRAESERIKPPKGSLMSLELYGTIAYVQGAINVLENVLEIDETNFKITPESEGVKE